MDWLTLWNVYDVLSIVMLLLAGAAYLVDHTFLTDHAEDASRRLFAARVQQNVGSIAVAVKWLRVLGHLQTFMYFSKTIKVLP